MVPLTVRPTRSALRPRCRERGPSRSPVHAQTVPELLQRPAAFAERGGPRFLRLPASALWGAQGCPLASPPVHVTGRASDASRGVIAAASFADIGPLLRTVSFLT